MSSTLLQVQQITGTLNVGHGAPASDLRTIDLGTCSWSRATTYGEHPYFYTTSEIPGLPTTNDYNIVCSGHNVILGNTLANFGNNASNLDIAHNANISGSTTGRVFVRNDAYNTVAEFRAAMRGVILVYKI